MGFVVTGTGLVGVILPKTDKAAIFYREDTRVTVTFFLLKNIDYFFCLNLRKVKMFSLSFIDSK